MENPFIDQEDAARRIQIWFRRSILRKQVEKFYTSSQTESGTQIRKDIVKQIIFLHKTFSGKRRNAQNAKIKLQSNPNPEIRMNLESVDRDPSHEAAQKIQKALLKYSERRKRMDLINKKESIMQNALYMSCICKLQKNIRKKQMRIHQEEASAKKITALFKKIKWNKRLVEKLKLMYPIYTPDPKTVLNYLKEKERKEVAKKKMKEVFKAAIEARRNKKLEAQLLEQSTANNTLSLEEELKEKAASKIKLAMKKYHDMKIQKVSAKKIKWFLSKLRFRRNYKTLIQKILPKSFDTQTSKKPKGAIESFLSSDLIESPTKNDIPQFSDFKAFESMEDEFYSYQDKLIANDIKRIVIKKMEDNRTLESFLNAKKVNPNLENTLVKLQREVKLYLKLKKVKQRVAARRINNIFFKVYHDKELRSKLELKKAARYINANIRRFFARKKRIRNNIMVGHFVVEKILFERRPESWEAPMSKKPNV